MTDKPKRPRDANQLAKVIVDVAIGVTADAEPKKAVGQQKGGLKGGAARALVLPPEQRSEITRLAAEARWKKS